ncbi:MAG TPA: biotin/lipoyl-containing protein, partial [Anaerolineales bacterium]|nr:biotin/lipoyl-containing protein [Anaerolineales bacterium]
MTIKVVVPELGESVLEATVSRWLKKPGDFVNVGDVLVELETDKVNLEVGAKGSGVLEKIEVSEGQDVKVGDVLGTIDEKAEVSKASAPAPEPAVAETKAVEEEKEPASAGKDGREMQHQTAPQVTPVASRLARANDVDISKISGTGSEGRVTKADVEMFLQGQGKAREGEQQPPVEMERETQPPVESARAAPSVSVNRREERTRMTRRRRTIAQRLLEAKQNTAMLTTFNEIDMGAVMDLRSRRNEEFQKRFGIKLGFTSFFVKAAVSALKAFP